ncbi:MAG: primosomal protein N' [Patescibacteria group bacterium]
MQKKLIAQVAPLGRLPRERNFFDYEIQADTKIEIGDLVQIPFRSADKLGVVINTVVAKSYFGKLKCIKSVLSSRILSSNQIELAKKISTHYAVSLSMAINLFVPIVPNKNQKLTMAKKITTQNQLQKMPLLLVYNTLQKKNAVVMDFVNKVNQRNEQLLILVPEKRHLSHWLKILKTNAIVWHADLKIGEKTKIWNATTQNQAKIILATRSGLFLPFVNLGGIIVDDEDNENYKQSDQNPRFDSIEIVNWMKTIYHCSLALISPAPRAEDWFKANHKIYSLKVVDQLSPSKITIVDMTNEPMGSNIFPLSAALLEKIKQTLNKKKKVYLHFNRRGSSTAVLCIDCKRIAKCDLCAKILVWHETLKRLVCHNCQKEITLPIPCPQCGGSHLHFLGAGLEKLEKLLKQEFKNIQLFRIDGDMISNQSSVKLKKAEIVLGTNLAWKYLDFGRFDLIGIVSIDNELAIPEFRAEEFAWQKLRYFITNSAGEIYIQTWQPESMLIKYLVKDIDKFYDWLFIQRKKFNWPPFVELIKFTVKDTVKEKAKSKIDQLKQLINNKQYKKNILEITLPYAGYHSVKGYKYIYHLLLKYNNEANPAQFWSKLPADTIIDRHPRYILS